MGATFGTLLKTWWKGVRVGEDQFANKYYREKKGNRRWVIFDGLPEASKVPPDWHAWLHRTTDEVPASGGSSQYAWEKPHSRNLTGTDEAYRPSGSLLDAGVRPKATGDYEPWQPQ